MKKPEWLFVIALLLIVGYFGYRHLTRPRQLDPLQLVPGTAVAVYERPAATSLTGRPYWADLQQMAGVDQGHRLFTTYDSLLAARQWLQSTRPLLVSLHVTGSRTAGLMYYLPGGLGVKEVLEAVWQQHTGRPPQVSHRQYNGFVIHELRNDTLEWSMIAYKDYLIVSRHGFLVEDVVRNIKAAFATNFMAANPALAGVPQLHDDDGNLYINGRQLPAFWHTFLPPGEPAAAPLAVSAFFDLAFSEEGLLLSGFLFDGPGTFASLFAGQEPAEPGSLLLTSNEAALAMTVVVSDVAAWHERWYHLLSPAAPDPEAQTFVRYLDGDLTLSVFSVGDYEGQRLLVAGLADAAGMRNLLNKRAEKLAARSGDTVYYESFAGHGIGLLEEAGLPAAWLGRSFGGFPVTHYTFHGRYLVLASSAPLLQKWLRDLEADNVWGRQAATRSFISENLGETTFALVLRNPQAWSLPLDMFNSVHLTWWRQNEKVLKQFGLAAFQLTNLDNRYYTALSLVYEPRQVETGSQHPEEVYLTQLAGPVLVRPKVVRNHRDGSFELLLQDSARNLLLLDKAGGILWQHPLPGPVVSSFYQIDQFQNGKLQYLFATDSAVWLIDRNGRDVEGFPVPVSDFVITGLYVFDYDHDKKYRFALADDAGHLRLYNQHMELLGGWDPQVFNSALSDQVFHVRVRGKDRIVIGLQNGRVHLRNRRGEPQPGFPVELEFNLRSPLHFSPGNTFAASRFRALSEDGLLVEFDLNGREYARNQLYQPSNSTTFTLVKQAGGRDFIIVRQDMNRLSLLSREGDPLFEKDYADDHPRQVQYYVFGVDKFLYVVRDTVTGRLYLYNGSGDLINATELYSRFPVSVIYRKSQAKCYLYTAYGQTIGLYKFDF